MTTKIFSSNFNSTLFYPETGNHLLRLYVVEDG